MINGMKSIVASMMVLTTLFAVLAPPVARAVTVYDLNITVTIDGFTSTSELRVLDKDDDGVIVVDVSNDLLGRIQEAFGTVEFVFPGQYTGTFSFGSRTANVTLQSDDSFILRFV